MIVDASDQIEEADALVENANKVKDLADAHTNEALVEKMQDISEEFKTAAEVFWPLPTQPFFAELAAESVCRCVPVCLKYSVLSCTERSSLES
jgi:hypothetical protein